MFRKKVVEKIKTQILCVIIPFFYEYGAVMGLCGEIWYSGADHIWQYTRNMAHALYMSR